VTVLQKACSKIVQNSLGKWPAPRAWFTLEVTSSDNKITAKCLNVSPHYKAPLEYAFYLNVDGVKNEMFWYQDCNVLEIPRPNISEDRLSITGFVREKINPDKKSIVTMRLKKG
jgi:hypothetical protein